MNDGWVKLSDPGTGKEFYANKFTRQTQWEAPPGFIDPALAAAAAASAPASAPSHSHGFSASSATTNSTANPNPTSNTSENDLPAGWEQMYDKASGKHFYVDHANQNTSWEHPGSFSRNSNGNNGSSIHGGYGQDNSVSTSNNHQAKGTATGFGFVQESSTSTNPYGQNPSSRSMHTAKPSSSTAASSWGTSSHPPPSTTMGRNTSSSSKTSSSMSYAYKPSSFANTIDDQSSKYYSNSGKHPNSMPQLEFKCVKVPDRLRPACPSTSCAGRTIFTISKRRHHCRLCGDIYCDACSSHRVLLPLGGVEFEKPVRVCDECHVDVDKGNYFSMRRYLTPLLLYDGDNTAELQKAYGTSSGKNDDGSAVEMIDSTNVAAALTSLSEDLDAILSDPSSFSEKMTIGADKLIPAICRHLAADETSDRAIKALSNLLTLGSVVGDNSFASSMYLQEDSGEVFGFILNLLEWSGTGLKTLAVQEQAAKVIFYLTSGGVMDGILEMEEANGQFEHEGWFYSAVLQFDVPRVLKSMLDHTTQSASPSLQRWAAACIQNLIGEDHRRACEAVSEAMSMGMTELRYVSFMVELVSSGGVMILSSLVASDDADTRAHAMAALAQIIHAARELNVRIQVFIEAYQVQNIQTCSETAIIETVVSSGACGPSLAQLLLSADNASATVACNFARTLVFPIISEPAGSSVPCYHRLFSTNTKLNVDNSDGLKEYRQAALDMGASDGFLSALVHLVNEDIHTGASRPVELRRSAMEILAAVAHTLSYWDSKIKNCGKSIETMDESVLQHHEKISVALTTLEEEHTAEVVLAAFSASSNQLNMSRDSTNSQLKEASALVMSALASCSPTMAGVFISSNILTSLITLSSDEGLNSPSYRGAWSSRRLPMLEAIASILVQGWKSIQNEGSHIDHYSPSNNGSSKSLEVLLESLDAGLVPLISRILNSNQEFAASERSYADTRARIAVCHSVSAIFGIGRGDVSTMGFSRIFEAMGNRHRIIPQILYLLGSVVPEVQKNASQGRNTEKDIPLLQLLEAILLATGGICGSDFISFGSMDIHGDYAVSPGLGTKEKDVFSTQFEEICVSASDIISKNSFLPSTLVGAFGEGSVMPALRLVSTVAENGHCKRVNQQLVRSGVLTPLTDMLRDAMNIGDYYIFDACVVAIGHAGPHMNSSSENNSIRALRDCVKLFSSILAISDDGGGTNAQKLVGLKKKCIKAIDLLSTNSSLWTVIVAHFVPCFMEHWLTSDKFESGDAEDLLLIRAGLRTISRVISVPTHAVFIANTGIASSLSNIICGSNNSGGNNSEVEALSIQILHTLLSYSEKKGPPTERIEAGVVDIYALDVACFLLSRDMNGNQDHAVHNVRIGFEIMLSVLIGLEDIRTESLHQSPRVIGFVETISSNEKFLKRLCATLLSADFKRQTGASPEIDGSVEQLYGLPFIPFEGKCGHLSRSTDAALHILFWMLFYSSVVQSQNSSVLWDIFMLHDDDISDQISKYQTISAASSIFLNLCTEKSEACLPINKSKIQYYERTALPVVRERLLHALSVGSTEYVSVSDGDDDAMQKFQSRLVYYRVPQLCLDLMASPLLTEQAFQALESALKGPPGVLLGSMVSEKKSLMSLFNLLNLTENEQSLTKEVAGKIKVFSAATLSSAGELGILGPAVNQLGLRSFAVASLSAACLMDDQNGDECLAEDLTEEGSSMSMLCLHGLVGVLSSDIKKGNNTTKVMMSPAEAQAIASGLGKKLSSMVLERFMHKAERQHILGDSTDEEAIHKFPEVTLLCALASSKEALTQLCATGGLEALSLVAGEGELSAINALLEACQVDPMMIIDVDGHISALQVIGAEESFPLATKKSCYDLLISISSNSRAGRDAVCESDGFLPCINHASNTIVDLANACKSSETSKMKNMKITDSNTATPCSLELAAISFLSSLVNNNIARNALFGNKNLESSIEMLARDADHYEVQHAAIVYLGSSVRYIKSDSANECASPEIFQTMLSIINSSQLRTKRRQVEKASGLTSFGDFSKSHHFNENLILATACRVVESLLPTASPELVTLTFTAISKIWSDTLNFQIVSSKKAASKSRNSGMLMFNMSSILLLATGRNDLQALLKASNLLRDLLRFILFDPTATEKLDKNESDESSLKDSLHWRGALAQSLQCIAVLSDNHGLQHDDCNSYEELISSVESNPSSSTQINNLRTFALSAKKAPSQTRTIKTSLERIEGSSTDAVSSIAASRILQNIFG